MLRAATLAAALALPLAAAGAPADPPPTPSAESAPSEPGAIPADLPARFRDWLDEVEPLLLPEERTAFLALAADYQRDRFVDRFWAVRDPFPQTPQNELRTGWDSRWRTARERYPAAGDVRRVAFSLLDEPKRIVKGFCSDRLRPLEVWTYAPGPLVPRELHFVFFAPHGGDRDRYVAFRPAEGLRPILEWSLQAPGGDAEALRGIAEECPNGSELAGAIVSAADWQAYTAIPGVLPRPSAEWVRTFTARSTTVPEGAAALPARLDLRFPARWQSRTVVQGVVSVAADAAAVDARGALDFVVDGEVLRDGALFEQFRYRFAVPAGGGGEVPLVFERRLRPGSYQLVLRVEDETGARFWREMRDLEVPSPTSVAADAAPAPASAPGPAADPVAEANRALPPVEASLRLAVPTGQLLIGMTRLEAVIGGEGVAAVEFTQDGRTVLRKRQPPWSVELDLGAHPTLHRLGAIARDAAGTLLAQDQVVVNGGAERFAVRLLSPERGAHYTGSLRAQAEVEVPSGRKLDRVELYLDEALAATLFQPPFVQPLVLPAAPASTATTAPAGSVPPPPPVSYVRAVAYLDDGTSTEDVAFVNLEGPVEEMAVSFVELYTSVLDRRGHPVEDLRRDEVTVLEDGTPQEIRRFEKVTDRPVHVGLLLDTSGSMIEELDEVERAAMRFFETVLRPQDRAELFTFADQPTLVVPLTDSLGVLAGGLAGLHAEGETALYDAVVQGLYSLGGLPGKRALLVLSDGEDTRSRYTWEDAIEYARHLGVAIYPIGLRLPARGGAQIRSKLLELANETGGSAHFVERENQLAGVYEEIEQELRSQLLVAYQSSQTGDRRRFREVQVKVARPGVEVRTMRGYYP